ncbi:MAG: transporter permease [Firmicutes bacterium]|nr:transporter permease [Bacillota bacterium]
MAQIDTRLLREIAELEGTPKGAYNIRKNGKLDSRASTANIQIISKEDQPGIDIHVKPGTRGESIHIPVIITESGWSELVYNDFFMHDGLHTFHVGANSKVRYVERHYGEGEGTGARIMNPQTVVNLEKGASIQLDTSQIRGVDSTRRYTKVTVGEGAEAVITEKLLTHGKQFAESEMDIFLEGEEASARVISRSVAQDGSEQVFYPRVVGNSHCFGHVQCDAIIMNQAKVKAIPAISANHTDAQLIHEAAIGRIAGDQILKLMTLGLTEAEAEEEILNGFLR